MVEESVAGHVLMIGIIFLICYIAHWLQEKF